MLFTSSWFILVFLPPALAGWYALAAHPRARLAFGIAMSTIFYGVWDWRFVPLPLGLAVLTLLAGRAGTGWAVVGLVLNLGALGFFKYQAFLASAFLDLTGTLPWQLSIALPLGISFFVFQKVAFLADVRRGTAGRPRGLDFVFFVMFFPQLIAGPIVRHHELIPQLRHDPRTPAMWANLGRGGVLFVIGMAKKIGLADTLAPGADRLFSDALAGTAFGLAQAWQAALTFGMQIYFDFSGYSDMAIGLALMFGLVLPFNFDAPYRTRSLAEFWRRWHMTLSRLLRDDLYIPLGGNRRGFPRQLLNLLVTMLLAGLWHGAAWTFVAWGGLHGLGLALGAVWARRGRRLPAPAGWVLTTAFVMAAWVLFRAETFASAATIYRGLLGFGGVGHWVRVDNGVVLWVAALVALTGPTSQQAVLQHLRPHRLLAWAAAACLVWLMLMAGGRLPQEFIYFQF
ncbi:MAG: MBOAT family protein [Acetobacteraceae bacterium]|nr:MBOAT family protein [Acetobacteraceae bacterium]